MSRTIANPSLRKKGYVMVTMAAAAFALMGAVGLAIDVGRLFSIKSETQAYADAAALAAALKLDGTAVGIANAQAAVNKPGNTWNFNTTAMPAPTVEFAQTAAGPWSANPGAPAGYVYARVTATVQAPLAFMPVAMSKATRKYKQAVISRAVAAQISITSFGKGVEPYTAVSVNTTGPNFGLTVGQEYDMQWPQFNGTRQGCNNGTPEKCFNAPPCAGDLANKSVLQAVSQNWGSNNNGYWGFSSNSDIKLAILDGKQTQPISVGMNIAPILTNGNKAAQADILDQRNNEDAYQTDNVVANYLASSTHNGRRLMLVPIVDPTAVGTSTILGFGQFMLYTNGVPSNYYKHNSNGNDPYCAVYVGPFVLNADNPGGATGGTGAYQVTLVE